MSVGYFVYLTVNYEDSSNDVLVDSSVSVNDSCVIYSGNIQFSKRYSSHRQRSSLSDYKFCQSK